MKPKHFYYGDPENIHYFVHLGGGILTFNTEQLMFLRGRKWVLMEKVIGFYVLNMALKCCQLII